jgi:hypothetical protein
MNDQNNIDPEIEAALDGHVKWMNDATELATAGDWQALQTEIERLDEQQVRALLYIALLARGGDLNRLREIVAKPDAAPMN